MKYKKTEKTNYNLHLINTKRFKTINIAIFLTKEFDKDNIVLNKFLIKNIVYSSKKYNTKNKIAIKGEELYGTNVRASFGISGALEEIIFLINFLNPKYTSNKYLKSSIDFLYEVLFNPNVDDEEFNKDFFNIIKKEIIAQTNAVKDNPNLFSSIKYSSIMYKDTPSAYSTYPTLEEIDKVTPKSLYNHYKKLFNGQYKINIVVLGEIDDSIEKIIDKKFSKMINSNEKLSFKINHKYSEKIVEKIDSLDYKQSKLYIGYRLNGLTYHEMYHVLNVYNTILGVMNDSILFNIVREKNSLCYSVGSYTSKDNPSLTIYAGINKNNYEKTKSLIIECVKNMSNKEYVEKLFDASKKTINTYLNNYYDEAYSQINYYYVNEFEDAEDIETLRKNINKVTIEEVCDLNKKISLSTIYLLKGDN